MKIFLTLIALLYLIQSPLTSFSLIKQSETTLQQENIFIQGLSFFTVTEKENFLFTDWKSASIKVFNSKGKLIKEIGRKGFGPGELAQLIIVIFTKINLLFVIQ